MDPVDAQLAAYNARDLDSFLAAYAPDAVVEDAGGQPMMTGHAGLRAVYGPLFAESPALRAEVRTRIRVGEFVIDEEHVTGANLPGFPSELHAAVVYRVCDGRIVHVRVLL